MMRENDLAVTASDSILQRAALMGRFIRDRHLAEFETYWRDNYPGKASPNEFIDFITDYPEQKLILQRKVIL